MIFREKNAVFYLQFARLNAYPGLWHGIFTRRSGHSKTPYHSLNVAFGVGDDTKRVQKNRDLISSCTGSEMLLFCRQVHGNGILQFKEDGDFGNLRTPRDDPPVGDAMLTNRPGVFLVIQVADCQPVLLYDPIRQVIANVHVGWRGSVQNILARTVEVLKNNFGCRPADLIAAIGPSLGPCCAEFVHYTREIPAAYWKYKDKSDCFDFWAISRDQLRQAGLLTQCVHTSQLCTRCRTDLFFSYRKEGTTGRFAAIIGLKGHRP